MNFSNPMHPLNPINPISPLSPVWDYDEGKVETVALTCADRGKDACQREEAIVDFLMVLTLVLCVACLAFLLWMGKK